MRRVLTIGAAFAATSILAPDCVSQTPPSEYTIREERTPSPSIVPFYAREEIVRGSTVPVNKRYNDMTLEERSVVHRWYEGTFEANDEPPFPSEGLKPIYVLMAKAQAKLLVTGNLVVIATVGADGEVVSVKTIGSPSPELSKFAAAVLYSTKFKPAVCKGLPCKMDYPFHYRFTVK